ncbi:MAG TPA: MBL fold metallo-hydrolase, partial [Desulfatiglandales bacterium]|nr:MBL fold metallo-hydrolase [Desulfatiglandales bacterium]
MKERNKAALSRIGATFWGARGSLPATITEKQIRDKLFQVLARTRGINLDTVEGISSFIETLPFSLRSTYGCNTSCVEIRGAEDYILCDAGTGIRDFGGFVMKHQKSEDVNIFHLFISHLHWDHIQGFPFFTPAYIPGNRVNIYGGHERLEEAFIRQQESISFPVPLDRMAADIRFNVMETDREYEIGGLKVRAIKQDHPGGSFSYRFSRQDMAIVYSTDSEHKPE